MATKRRGGASGAPTTHAEKIRRGFVRAEVYVPPELVSDLAMLVELEATETGLRADRCRTPAIVRAIRERADRVRRKR